MKTKIIPFDLETAKKIQAVDITGSIKTKNGLTCKIVSYCDGTDFFVERTTEMHMHRWCYPYTKDGRYIDGKNNGGTDYDLILEVSEKESEHKFKPFDKVLVRKNDDDEQYWQPKTYSFFHPAFKEHVTTDGMMYEEVLPYEGNECLVGTIDKPKKN